MEQANDTAFLTKGNDVVFVPRRLFLAIIVVENVPPTHRVCALATLRTVTPAALPVVSSVSVVVLSCALLVGVCVCQVERMLVTVIGKHKLHYWNLLDQLLLMS